MGKLKTLLFVTILVGISSTIFLLLISGDPNNEFLWGFSPTRLLMLGGLVFTNLFLAWILFQLFANGPMAYKITTTIDTFFNNDVTLFIVTLIAKMGIAVGGSFFVSWFIFGEKYLAIYIRLAPIIFLVFVFFLQLLIYQYRQLDRAKNGYYFLQQIISQKIKNVTKALDLASQRFHLIKVFFTKHKLQWWLNTMAGGILIILYLSITINHAITQNVNLRDGDQNAFLEFIKKVYLSNFRFSGERNRMPLYAYVQALFYDPSSGDAFLHGKYVNIALSVILLFFTFLLLNKIWCQREAIFYVVIVAFSLFIFRAPYLQAELLFYFLIFVSFLAMCSMFYTPSKKLGVFTGIISGLAQLTKASMLIGLGVFTVFYLLKSSQNILKSIKNPKERIVLLRKFRDQVISLLFVLIGFFAVISPYIMESKRVYGQYFYNVNSTFYVWYDSFEEAKAGTIAHGDREGWPKMPPEDIPSFSKYIREHTWDQILDRIERGAKRQITILLVPYGQFNYTLILFISLVAVIIKWRKISMSLLRENITITGFTFSFFGAYLSSFAWYHPISGGYRFTYSLFMITLVIIIVLLKRYFHEIGSIHILDFSIDADHVLIFMEKILLILLMYDILFYIPHVLDVGYFGG